MINNTNIKRPAIWRTPSISADGLKIFACVMMLVSSIGITVVENGLIHLNQYTQAQLSELLAQDSQMMFYAGLGSVFQLLGGLSVPIFAFLLVEGFLHTSDYKKYLVTMIVFAVLSEVPYDLANYERFWDLTGQNALFSMVISLLMLYFLRMAKEKGGTWGGLLQLLLVVVAVVWVSFLRAGYGLCIVLLVAIFYIFYTRNVLKTILGVLVSLLYVTGPLSFYGIWCYNEKRSDRLPKYFYYFFYPIQLLILGSIVKYCM